MLGQGPRKRRVFVSTVRFRVRLYLSGSLGLALLALQRFSFNGLGQVLVILIFKVDRLLSFMLAYLVPDLVGIAFVVQVFSASVQESSIGLYFFNLLFLFF